METAISTNGSTASEWTALDRQRFRAAWLKLRARFRLKDDSAICYSDAEILESLPIEAVELAFVRLATEGSSDNFFPKTPEMFQMACEEAAGVLERSYQRTRLLPPAPEIRAADMKPIRVARARFLKQLRAAGARNRAIYFHRTIPLAHPDDDLEGAHCKVCSDEGRYGKDGIAYACDCRDTNPVIIARELRGRPKVLMHKRAARAAQLRPSSRPTSLLAD